MAGSDADHHDYPRWVTMGAWNTKPWDNDTAADWFGDLFEALPIAARVEQALNQEVEDAHEQVRAAASLWVLLGRVYVWPVDELDRHLTLAADKLELVRELEVYAEVPEIVQEIDCEIRLLRRRAAASRAGQGEDGDWWSSWSQQTDPRDNAGALRCPRGWARRQRQLCRSGLV